MCFGNQKGRYSVFDESKVSEVTVEYVIEQIENIFWQLWPLFNNHSFYKNYFLAQEWSSDLKYIL